jgi:hypothetical protein
MTARKERSKRAANLGQGGSSAFVLSMSFGFLGLRAVGDLPLGMPVVRFTSSVCGSLHIGNCRIAEQP